MRLLTGHDTGGCPPYTIGDGEVVFDPASPDETYRFDAVIDDAPTEFDVVLRIDGEGTGLMGQGLVTSSNGERFETQSVREDADGWLRATVSRAVGIGPDRDAVSLRSGPSRRTAL